MWEIDLSWQIQGFLCSMLCGICICTVFDILNIFVSRLSKKGIFVFDIVFFVFVAFFDFCLFLVFCNGEIRGFIFAGEILGFLLCKLTLARAYIPVVFLIIKLIKRPLLRIKSVWIHIFEKILHKD